jgi:hypothetical protein
MWGKLLVLRGNVFGAACGRLAQRFDEAMRRKKS